MGNNPNTSVLKQSTSVHVLNKKTYKKLEY